MHLPAPERAGPVVAVALLLLAASPAYAADGALKNSLADFFARGVRLHGATAELVRVIHWPDAKGAVVWHLPQLHHHPARMSLIAEQGRGRRLRRWYVPVQVRWWAKALVSRQDLPPRSRLMPSLLRLARVDVTGHAGRWWSKIEHLAGARTLRPLAAGQPIFAGDIKRPPLLERGKHVTLIANIGGVTVTTLAKVLRPAGLGDVVRVQNLSSKRVVQATVVSRHTVEVTRGGAS